MKRGNIFLFVVIIFLMFNQLLYAGNKIKIYTSTYNQVETPIAINPTDPNNLIVGVINLTMDNNHEWVGVFYTYDGGAHWSAVEQLSVEGAADPEIAFDEDGVAYLIYHNFSKQKVYLKKSYDGGATWPETHIVTQNENAYLAKIGISPKRNANGYFNIYISYSVKNDLGYKSIKVKRSTDGGSSFQYYWGLPGTQTVYYDGSGIKVNTAGEPVVCYAELHNQGKGWEVTSIHVKVDPINKTEHFQTTVHQIGEYDNQDGYYYLKQGRVRVDSYPRIAIDTGIDPSSRDKIYVTYSSEVNNIPNIYYITGTRNGSNYTWNVSYITAHSTYYKWNPALFTGPDGNWGIMYYSSQNDTPGKEIYVWFYYNGVNHTLNGNGFVVEQNGKTFLGDYHGITGWYGKAYGVWAENHNNKREAYFNTYDLNLNIPSTHVKLTLNQLDTGDQPFGRMGVWNQGKFSLYKVPATLYVEKNSNQVIRSLQDFKPGTTEKFNRWNVDDDVKNHRSFDIGVENYYLYSKFKNTYSATITTEYLTVNQSDLDTVGFIDPWLRIEGDPAYYDPPYGYRNLGMDGAEKKKYVNLPLELSPNSVFMGVFKNQGYYQGNWYPPYYKVFAPEKQVHAFHGDEITWYFMHWKGLDVRFQDKYASETGVIFEEDGAVVKAVYKGHLASSTSRVTRYNTQKKMVYDGRTYHLVYEDKGEIYYTTSINGIAWTKEVRLSDGYGACSNPAIAISGDGSYIGVVWSQEGWIKLRLYKQGRWQSEQTVASIFYHTEYQTVPVIAYQSYGWFHIVWRDFYYENYVNLKIRAFNPGNMTFGSIVTITGTNALSCHPSLASGNHNKIHLAWEEDGQIYYSRFSYNGTNYIWDVNKELVSDIEGYSDHEFPSLTLDYYDQPSVMWQAWDNFESDVEVIMHRRKELADKDLAWGSITVFANSNKADYFSPDVTGFPFSQENDHLIGSWYKSGSVIWRAYYANGNWSSFEYTSGGQYPQISHSVGTTGTYRIMYRGDKSNPYVLKFHVEEKNDTGMVAFSDQRRGIISLNGCAVAYQLGDVQINGQPVEFVRLSTSEGWNDFRTEPFDVSGNLNISFYELLSVLNPDSLPNIFNSGKKLKIRLQLVDARTGNILAIPHLHTIGNVPQNVNSYSGFNVQLPFTGKAYIRASFSVPSGMGFSTQFIRVYQEPSGLMRDEWELRQNAVLSQIPSGYFLSQNYPNPFNPSTTIAFDLPEPGQVELAIYDVSGREIRRLVNENYPAGRHQVVWDGTDGRGVPVASGVYLYRLRAGNHVFTRKMILMK